MPSSSAPAGRPSCSDAGTDGMPRKGSRSFVGGGEVDVPGRCWEADCWRGVVQAMRETERRWGFHARLEALHVLPFGSGEPQGCRETARRGHIVHVALLVAGMNPYVVDRIRTGTRIVIPLYVGRGARRIRTREWRGVAQSAIERALSEVWDGIVGLRPVVAPCRACGTLSRRFSPSCDACGAALRRLPAGEPAPGSFHRVMARTRLGWIGRLLWPTWGTRIGAPSGRTGSRTA